MASPRRSGEAWDWRQLAGLGEQLLGASSLVAQRDRITAMAGHVLGGTANVWLAEDLFRLPDWTSKRTFPAQPPLEGMRRAVKRGRLIMGKASGGRSGKVGYFAALPLIEQNLTMGALQVIRPRGPRFSPHDQDLLEGLERIVSVGLYASHRSEVERFRREQLVLVRQVSAQIATTLEVDQLARQVTRLIQQLFQYYYVAIFTLRADDKRLRFRSSAGAARKANPQEAQEINVEEGQGLIGMAAATGEQIVVDDVRADSRYRFLDALPQTRSEVVIPLKIEQRVLGVLDVQSNKARGFHPTDLLILNALADNVARAIEGARLYSDLRRRADQLSLVADVSNSVTSTLELGRMLGDAADLIHNKFGYPHVAIFTVHPRRRVITFEAGSGTRTAASIGQTIPLDDPKGIIPWVAREGQTVLAADVTQDPRYTPSPLPPRNTRSELAIPLKFGDEVIGLLDIQSNRVNAFGEEDQLTLEAVAGTMAAAIRNADLFRSEQWRRQVSDSLREVAGLLSSHAGVDQVLEAILVQLERNLPVGIAAIWLLNEGELVLAAIHGADMSAVEDARQSMPAAGAMLERILASDVPLIRTQDDPVLPVGQAAGFGPDYSALIVPMRLGEQALGFISLSHRSPGRYGHEAQAMTTTFASYAAVAIENARLYDAAQEQAYASAALLQVAQVVASPGRLDDALSIIIRIVPILVGVHRAALYTWDASRELFRSEHYFGFSPAERNALVGRDFSGDTFPLLGVARRMSALVAHPLRRKASAKSWLKIHPGAGAADGVHPETLTTDNPIVMAVPLQSKNDFYGVMLLEEREGGRRFRPRRLEIIQGVAQQTALAIQDDRLRTEMVARERLETEVELARSIQRTFVPHVLPERAGWQLASRWRTARQVGGDFYDVAEIDSQNIAVFVADVADKGVPAALFMALTRTLVRAAMLETDSPAEALKRVNDLLYPDTGQGMFVTGVYGILDVNLGRLTYANAGHNPPLMRRSDGTVERLVRTGVALGAVEDANVEQRSVDFGPGDCLLMFTDGLTEASSPRGEFFGDRRLEDILIAGQFGSAEELLHSIDQRLTEFTHPEAPADDLTMVAIRRE